VLAEFKKLKRYFQN